MAGPGDVKKDGGAGWKAKSTKTGKEYIKILVRLEGKDYKLGLFRNEYNDPKHPRGPKSPDYSIMVMTGTPKPEATGVW